MPSRGGRKEGEGRKEVLELWKGRGEERGRSNGKVLIYACNDKVGGIGDGRKGGKAKGK